MNQRRAIWKRALDVLALLLVGMFAASATVGVFEMRTWVVRGITGAFALAMLWWFISLAREVAFLWRRQSVARNP